jgi:methyl-accepting chemotaxis protein
MSQDTGVRKRKRVFVKKGFQFRFVLRFCLVILGGVVISTGLLFFLSQNTLTSSFNHSRLVITSTGFAILPAVILTNLIILGLITLATIFVTLIVSHKIAGPLIRFEKEVSEIGEGRLTNKITLRKEDQMVEMAGCLNRMAEHLHGKIVGIRDGVVQAREAAVAGNAPEETVAQLKRVERLIEDSFTL